jgi:hypothetical protein
MANCHKFFLDFNSKITLPQNKKDFLRTSRDAVRDKIRKYFKEKENGFVPKFHGQGSFMTHTIIEPIDGEFDIDDGIYFNVKSEPSKSVDTFHQWIVNAVDGHTKQKPIDKKTCVRVTYANDYHLDLPIYYIKEGEAPRLAHKVEGWIESDPREFTRWLNSKADKNGQLKRIIRYLKAWSDCCKGQLPSGLIFSILTVENIVFHQQDDISLYETLCKIQKQLTVRFACYRPTTPINEDLLANYSQTNKEYFLNQLENFMKSAQQAVEEVITEEEACSIWQRYFGSERFPSNWSKPVTDSFSEFELSEYTPNRTEEFIEQLFPVYLSNDLKIECRVEQNGYRPKKLREMIMLGIPLLAGQGTSLQFNIANHNVKAPFEVKWKVRNVGNEAIKRNIIRGQILNDGGHCQRNEVCSFYGPHYVECYIIKCGVCVARDRIDVSIHSH